MANWVTIFKEKDRVRAELLKNELENNNIESVILDKVDHNYPVLGIIEIKVQESQKALAEIIINDFRIDD
jgi:Putative prokaryotic signal transducing protein